MYQEHERFEVAETRSCVDCGNSFDITKGEAGYFQEKGFTLPKRCKKCRQIKKMNKEAV